MLFNSFPFLLFFLIVTPLYYFTPNRWRWLILLVASCYFYACFIPAYLPVLLTIIAIDYIAGRRIEYAAGRKRKAFLILSLAINLGALAVFKYYNFFAHNIDQLLTLCHIRSNPLPLWRFALPLGLSFHTFQAMSYTIEVYKGDQKAERHPGIYALYVMFYPQLVAGPIERPGQLIHQFYKKHQPDYPGIADGLKKMLWGYFLKLVVADRLAIYVNYIYTRPDLHSRLALLTAIFFFAFQIYCDFAGYSLIAIGAAKTMGFTLAENFRQPYLTASLRDFWRRWHITLSTWFRDYLYIPLGGNRVGAARMIFNLLVVFLLSGLWHGAAWTFVIWGLLHWFVLSCEFLTTGLKPQRLKPAPRLLFAFMRWLITFSFLCFAWIFFRSAGLHQAIALVERLFDPHTPRSFPEEFRERVLLLCCFFGITCVTLADLKARFYPRKHFFLYHPDPAFRLISCTALIVIILLLGVFNGSQFIYFQF